MWHKIKIADIIDQLENSTVIPAVSTHLNKPIGELEYLPQDEEIFDEVAKNLNFAIIERYEEGSYIISIGRAGGGGMVSVTEIGPGGTYTTYWR